ncbi:MAG: putative DNA binding domain-containing protein [Rudanella sp.]|nr:putative DNA binding domain-containing protein [Rudanella sp.]
MDVLQLKERVKNAILVGESDFREFKSALEGKPGEKRKRLTKKICEDIGEALVAFANTDGGELLIGVEDDTIITGVPHSDEEIVQMLDAVRTHVLDQQPLPIVYNLKIEIDGKLVLFFQVEKGTSEVYQLPDGRVVIRKDKRTVPANIKHLQFTRQERISREFDRQFVDGATVNDLDLSLIQSLADSYLRGLTAEKYLQQFGLAEYAVNGLRLRQAAVLLFAKDVQKWHSRSQVRFLKVSGTALESGERYNVISDESITGNIFELIVKAWETLLPYLAYKTVFGVDARFEQKYTYPEDACREALLNAIAHRDYANHSSVEVYIYNDRIEIKSPGALLSTLTVQDLLALDNRHESRNAKITYVLKVNKFMRELGEGMKRIFMLMQDNDLKKPELYSNTNWFTITLHNALVYSPKENDFLRMFDRYNLSKNQKKIVLLGIEGKHLSPKDIHEAMNTKDRNTYDLEVTGLRTMDYWFQSVRAQMRISMQKRTTPRKKKSRASK